MPECDYCSASFDDEDSYLTHLKAEHRDELGPIDRRRVGDVELGDEGLPTGPIVLGVVILASFAIVGYVVFFAGGSGADGDDIGPAGSAHYHGTMEMVVLGEEVDFSREEYQMRADRFHFEGGDGEQWHAHATGVTLEYAMDTLGMEVEPDAVTYDGTTYTDDEYDVAVEVNGESVVPEDYVLEEGDHISIRVEEG